MTCAQLAACQLRACQFIVQDMLSRSAGTDASGNPILGDIGLYLSGKLRAHFKEHSKPIDLKYIDPTYMVRAIPTIPNDRVYCKVLGQNSVHAAFAGFTGVLFCRCCALLSA